MRNDTLRKKDSNSNRGIRNKRKSTRQYKSGGRFEESIRIFEARFSPIFLKNRLLITYCFSLDKARRRRLSSARGNSCLKEVFVMDARLSEDGKRLIECKGDDARYTTPRGVFVITSFTFGKQECPSLKTLCLSEDVCSIDKYAISGRMGLEAFEVAPDNSRYGAIDGVLFASDDRVLVKFPGGANKERYNVPKSVEVIADFAFSYNSTLREINLSDALKTIGEGAFEHCVALTKIETPERVKEIKADAFEGCYSLKSISLPASLNVVGSSAFNRCSALTSIVVPENVDKIKSYTFHSCSSLTSVALPDGVKSIDDSAFSECCSLQSLVLPEKLAHIGDCAFCECSSLKEIVLPKNVRHIGARAFCDCESLTKLVASDEIKKIGEDAFKRCDLLTIYAPKGSYIERYARKHNIDFAAID